MDAEREKALLIVLNHLKILIRDLNTLVIEYQVNIKYDKKPIQIIEDVTSEGEPRGLISDSRFIYICDRRESSPLVIYNLESKKFVEQNSLLHFNESRDIDLYQNNLYIVDAKFVTICNLQFQLLASFPIPDFGWSLKVNENMIFLTIPNLNRVFIYTMDGKVKDMIGTTEVSSKLGEFHDPRGLTLDRDFLFIWDSWNHRIQKITKKNYFPSHSWGGRGKGITKFNKPTAIHYYEDILYVGDLYCLQLFTCGGIFLQKLGSQDGGVGEGKFRCVWGICVIQNLLYVSDRLNNRIQVFKILDTEE